MRFAFVIFRYFPFGGLQRDFAALARAMVAAGHRVTVYCESWQGEVIDGVELVVLPRSRTLWNPAGVKAFVDRFTATYVRRSDEYVVGFNKMPGLDAYFAGDTCFAEKAYGQRSWFYRQTPRAALYLAYERAVFSPTSRTHILTLTPDSSHRFARFYGTPQDRFALLPPGIDRAHIACEDSEGARREWRTALGIHDQVPLVLCLGSGFHTKGVDRSLRAIAAYRAHYGVVALVIVGQDDPRPYERLATQLGIADCVFFRGPQSPVGPLLHSVDALLHLARQELAGNVLMEAMLCARPVVASAHCGFSPYIKASALGELTENPDDAIQVAAQLHHVLQSPRSTYEHAAIALATNERVFDRTAVAVAQLEAWASADASKIPSITHQDSLALLPPFDRLSSDAGIFEWMRDRDGDVARAMRDRETRRFVYDGQAFYRKWHRGVGWGEIIKNLIRCRAPVLGAQNEWDALRKLAAVGVPSLTPVAFGRRGKNPARQESFIVTRELANCVQLDDFFRETAVSVQIKWRIIQRVAEIVRHMHSAGINHRDLYLCHFMLQIPLLDEPSIHLVDLHRAQLRPQVPIRWQVKDLGALWFSAMDLPFTSRDALRFLKHYYAADIKTIMAAHSSVLQRSRARARATYKRDHGHWPT